MGAARFSSDLCVQLAGRHWILHAPLVYHSEILGRSLEVPIGFVTDFASVPRFLPLAFALTGDTAHRAAVVHDYLYRQHETSRRQADAVFFEAMRVTREPGWREWLMWAAVRAFGCWAYRHWQPECNVRNKKGEHL